MKKQFVLILSILLLSGCSTSYQKKGFNGGYEEMRLNSNAYLVQYKSNALTHQSTNYKHALRRAAELTRQNGYNYFKIVNVSDTTSQYTTPVTSTTMINENGFDSGTYSPYPYGHSSYSRFRNAQTTYSTVVSGGETYIRPGVAMEIKMLKTETNDCYEASVILSNFKNN